jgi:flavin-binding protein dodecin
VTGTAKIESQSAATDTLARAEETTGRLVAAHLHAGRPGEGL